MGQPRDNNQVGLYQSTGSENSYEFHPGVCVLPLAEEPPTDPDELANWSPVVTLQLHAPYRVRRMTYVADKKNNPPPAPPPEDTGAFVFVGGTMSVMNNLNTTFCNFDWKVECEYYFVENCVSRSQDGLVLGIPPFTWTTSTLNEKQGYSMPQLGAIRHAGKDALVGYRQGNNIVANAGTGELKGVWGYNTPSFYPGTLFYADLVNAGPPVFPAGQGS